MSKARALETRAGNTAPAEDDVQVWNQEDAVELDRPSDPSQYDISIAARDWTVETIVQQVKLGNIDLDPAFQRRNAWRDQRRSRLIESFILNFPVPQLVLAEHPRRKKTFIVIDGKQRLMTVAGLYLPDYRSYWAEPEFSGLSTLKYLNDVRLDVFLSAARFETERRQLSNADIRTTLITGFHDEGILYDIFYRINTGSVPLSSQELRQVLNRGDFARYLLEVTSTRSPLWDVLGIDEPDARLRDVELLLRLFAWRTLSDTYVGNMKPFLDDTMKRFNTSWPEQEVFVKHLIEDLFHGIETQVKVFGEYAGRKYKDGKFERALNRAVFEVQAYYFSFANISQAALGKKQALVSAYKRLSSDSTFVRSIEATTKSIDNYKSRFDKYRRMLRKVLGLEVQALRLGHRK